MKTKPIAPPKFTNKKKAIQVCASLTVALNKIKAGLDIMPTSMSWKEADDMTLALLEIEETMLEIKYKLIKAAS